MKEADLLQRIAQTLRKDIAPALDAEYPKTQAFMAAVVLDKLGRQIALAPAHAIAAEAELNALIADLNATSTDVPQPVRDAIATLARARSAESLSRLVETLYASKAALGERRFDELLALVRRTLRGDIERRMEFAE
jgi:hypothetical protein